MTRIIFKYDSLTNFMTKLQIDFHDTSSGPRVPAMTDYFGFTMASLNEKGSVFANPCKGEKNMSTLMYRPFSSWANNSEVRPLHFLFVLSNIFLEEPSSMYIIEVSLAFVLKVLHSVDIANVNFLVQI